MRLAGSKTTRLRLAGFVFTWPRLAGSKTTRLRLAGFVFTWLKLAKAGWRPRRTLVYAAWDAEEPGLLGSTEWVEHHAADLRAKAALYINTDSNYIHYFLIDLFIFLITFFKPKDIASPIIKCPILNSLISLIFARILVVL